MPVQSNICALLSPSHFLGYWCSAWHFDWVSNWYDSGHCHCVCIHMGPLACHSWSGPHFADCWCSWGEGTHRKCCQEQKSPWDSRKGMHDNYCYDRFLWVELTQSMAYIILWFMYIVHVVGRECLCMWVVIGYAMHGTALATQCYMVNTMSWLVCSKEL